MKSYWIILLSVLLCACSDFLEPKSQSEYVPETATALNEMLLGSAYPKAVGGKDIMSILTILDDDVCCSDSLGGVIALNNTVSYTALKDVFAWQPDFWTSLQEKQAFYVNYWENYYQYILGANAALDYIDDVNGTINEKNIVKAQAYALRAFYYFQLVNLFGEPYNYNKQALGVPLKINSAMNNLDLPRNTVEEVYEQILKDLDTAEELYESLPQELQFKKDYRVNLPMVQLLKSRVYLYMEDWENSMIYAQKVIDNPNFSLIDFNTLPAPSDKSPYYNFISMETSSESIWTFGSIDAYLIYVTNNNSLDVLTNPANPMSSVRYNYPFFHASAELLNSYENGDLRKESYIMKGKTREQISDYEYQVRAVGYSAFGKFAIEVNNNIPAPASANNFAHAFRLAEAYLNLAEAAAQAKEDKIALAALNVLRIKRIASAFYEEIAGISGDELVQRIRKERRLELCYEGHRWFDLRRYGMPSFSRAWKVGGELIQTYTLIEKDPAYTLAIPKDVLEKNKKLEQNKLPNPR